MSVKSSTHELDAKHSTETIVKPAT